MNEQLAQVLTDIDLDYNHEITSSCILEDVRKRFINGLPYQYVHDKHQAMTALLKGYALLLLEGIEIGLALQLRKVEARAIRFRTN